jgi:hypothetical protein
MKYSNSGMKYSLRSLMIEITLVAVIAGVFVAWRDHRVICLERAAYHRSNIVKLSDSITLVPALYGVDEGEESKLRDVLAQFEAEYNKQRLENASHEAKDSAYQHAVWRPWERLWIDDLVTSEEIAEYFKAKELARQERIKIADETQTLSRSHYQVDGETLRKLADEAREKYGVP